MDSICSEIKEDMHKIEEDSKKIDCYAILDLIKDTFKCILDSLKCCRRQQRCPFLRKRQQRCRILGSKSSEVLLPLNI